jgi:choline kinase
MRAVILAAGCGSRMGSHTEDRPKCLIEVGGRRLLDRQLAALYAAGVVEVAVVTGWCSEQFTGLPVHRFHNAAWQQTSMVDSLACAGDWLLAEPVLVCYGDIVFAPEAAARLCVAEADIAVAYDPQWADQWRRRFDDPLSDAETFQLAPGGITLRAIGEKPSCMTEIEGQYVGLVALTPAGWLHVRAALDEARRTGGRTDFTGLLSRLLRQSVLPIAALALTGPWHEFDHPRDLEVGRAELDRLDRLLFADPQRGSP